MLEIDKKLLFFKKKNIWFSDKPFEVPDADVVFFYACRTRVDDPAFQREDAATMVIDLTLDMDTIWGNMSKKSCRYYINRAEREGITVSINKDYEVFYEMYSAFVEKKGFDTTSESLDFMKKYCSVFVSWQDGKPLTGALMLQDESRMRWLFGASNRLEEEAADSNLLFGCANRLTIWTAIKLAKETGLKVFDLGGYYDGGDPENPQVRINRFKEKFGGELVTYYTYWKYNSWLYRVVRRAKDMVSS